MRATSRAIRSGPRVRGVAGGVGPARRVSSCLALTATMGAVVLLLAVSMMVPMMMMIIIAINCCGATLSAILRWEA